MGLGLLAAVGAGTGVAVGLRGGWAAKVACTRASTVASISTVGTAAGVSVGGWCVEAEELGSAGGAVAEPHPIIRMANSVTNKALRRYILAPPNYDFLRIAFQLA